MSGTTFLGTAGRVREAVILAGGYGTRLAQVAPGICKPMAPVADVPFLCRVLDLLDAAGFAHVIIADGYRREQIESYFMGAYRGIEIDYSSEDDPLLTGGAVKKALSFCICSEVFVLNGDTWFDVDFSSMEKVLAEHCKAQCCIAAKRKERFDRYGTLDVREDGLICGFREKAPCAEGIINGGVYLIRREALVSEPDVFSLEDDWFSRVVADGVLVSYEADGGFIDIGVPEDYARAQYMFGGERGRIRLALFDRDGTINVNTGHLYKAKECELIAETVELICRYSSDPSWRVAVVTNQAGIAKGMYGVNDMRALHRFMAEMLAKAGARVDAWYFCPHHPSFTGECECRKPEPGLIRRAIRDFRAEPSECTMYGDSEKDMLAARAAGVEFYPVKGDGR